VQQARIQTRPQRPSRGTCRLLVVVGLVVVLASGCGSGVAGGDCSGGTLDGNHCVPYTPGERVARVVEATAIDESRPFTDVTCRVVGTVAQCNGKAADGNTVRAAFRVVETQPLVPLCPSPAHPSRRRGPFCPGG
jgi:hypothetical protein